MKGVKNLVTYSELISKIYKEYLDPNKRDILLNSNFAIVRSKMLKDMYEMYRIFTLTSDQNKTELELHMIDGKNPIVDATKNVIKKIIESVSIEEMIVSLQDFQNNVLNFFNNKVLMAGAYNSLHVDYGYLDFFEEPNYDFDKLFADLKTSKKFINLLWLSAITSHEPKDDMRQHWKNFHANTDLKVYGYFFAPNTPYNVYEEAYRKLTDRHLVEQDTTKIRVSTRFDIGFLDFSNYRMSDDEVYSKFFYYINSHINKGAPLIIGIHKYNLTEAALAFFSKYLSDVSVYTKENSDYVLIVGLTRRRNSDDIKTYETIISQMIGISSPDLVYDVFGCEEENIIFRTTYISEQAVLDVLEKNQEQVNNIIQDQIKIIDSYSNQNTRRPLIPFSPGQLGLVLVSGDIDGIIDEGDGCYHVIKGSVYRNPTTTTEEDGTVSTRKTTYNVATSVTVMLANGKKITLR